MTYGIPLRLDPMNAAYFGVEVDGILDVGFRRVEPGTAQLDVFKLQQYNLPYPIIKTVAESQGLIKLHQGWGLSDSLIDWYDKTKNYQRGDKSPRRSVSIAPLEQIKKYVNAFGGSMQSDLLFELKRLNYFGCIPIELKLPNYDAHRGQPAIMTLTIAYIEGPELPYSLGIVGDILSIIGG